ncbi:MAG: hypothetical protein EX263_02860 [Flavobacteriaceae bacterium]|nr:hypothetical protein [Flavobacteriaceae bacterium]NNL34012.1 hypothetical protein [Flavobacteriaceae bacterium]RZW56085.1 MAG: hypothetical protein EX263_02860 [Flavobacteriaceae bacterium]
MNLRNYFKELQRRHVVKAGIAYLVFTWLMTQVLSILIPVFEFPQSILKTAIIVMAVGFPIWLIFAWVYDFTPDGLKKTDDVTFDSDVHARKNVKLNRFIIAGLSVAIILLVVNQFRMKSEITEIKMAAFGTDFKSSIAVMAFADMSPQKDHEYFSDGISEELLNLLAKTPELKVISRTSSFSYKDKDVTATEIGEQLKVSHILEGSIRKAGNTVRITAQLIRTADGAHEWSHTYDRNLDSIFKIQDEIAARVCDELKLTLLGKDQKSQPVNTEAYTMYLQASHLTLQNTDKAYIAAEELIQKSLAIDSSYAKAWRLLASIYDTGTYNFSIWETHEGIPKGLHAAKKAIALDPSYGRAYANLASLQELSWQFNESAKSIEKALELDPNNAIILGIASLMTFGDLEKGLALQEKAIQLDPLVYGNYFNLGFTNYRLNRFEEAEEAFKKFETYYPNWQILHYMKGMVSLGKGDLETALTEIEQETHKFFSLYGRNFIYYALGRYEEADNVFKEFKEKFEKTDPANTADVYAFRGDYDKSFDMLYQAYKIKDPVLIEALSYPNFKPMYDDPRWTKLIKMIDLPENHGYFMK